MDSSSSSESEFSDNSDLENDKRDYEDEIEINSSSDSETNFRKSAKNTFLASNLVQYSESESSSFSNKDFSPKTRRRSLTLQEPDATKEIKHYFKKMKNFWTKRHNLKRASAPITVPTFDKARERMRGYLEFVRNNNVAISPQNFQDERLIEDFLDHLRNERMLNPATIANYANAILYAIKFSHRERGPKYDDIPIVARLRHTSTLLQKEGHLLRPNTHDQMENWAKWGDIVKALGKQKTITNEAATPKQRSREMMNLVILSLYVQIPPGRAKEIRTAQIFEEKNEAEFHRFRDKVGKNFVVLKTDGDVVLHFDEYKTQKTYGPDVTAFEANLEITRNIRHYVRHDRRRLLMGREHNFLIVNNHGDPYSASSFTQALQKLFKSLLGVPIGVRGLRSSFITHAFSQSDCTDSMKESIASAMRHSKREAERTYDRRTGPERKRIALSFAQSEVSRLGDDEEAEPPCRVKRHQSVDAFDIGDFVAFRCSESTLEKPVFLLGRIQKQNERGFGLLWYKNLKDRRCSNLYKLCLDGDEWEERPEALVRVDVSPTRDFDTVVLKTEAKQIQRAAETMSLAI